MRVQPTLGHLEATESPDRVRIAALASVTLAVPVLSDEGGMVPAGAQGTVVGVWAGGDAFEVEFTQPFEALASVEASQLVQPTSSDS